MKIENIFRKDIIQVAEKMYIKKLEKKALEKENSILLKKLSLLKEEFEAFKALHEINKNKMQTHTEELHHVRTPHKKNSREEYDPSSPIGSTPKHIRNSIKKTSVVNVDNELIIRSRTEAANHFVFEKQQYVKQYEIKRKTFEKRIKDLSTEVTDVKKKITYAEIDIRLYSVHFDSMVKDQTTYYLEILFNGIDVRYEGLIWVVKRLVELNTTLDYSYFPKVLDNEQIDYLINVNIY